MKLLQIEFECSNQGLPLGTHHGDENIYISYTK